VTVVVVTVTAKSFIGAAEAVERGVVVVPVAAGAGAGAGSTAAGDGLTGSIACGLVVVFCRVMDKVLPPFALLKEGPGVVVAVGEGNLGGEGSLEGEARGASEGGLGVGEKVGEVTVCGVGLGDRGAGLGVGRESVAGGLGVEEEGEGTI